MQLRGHMRMTSFRSPWALLLGTVLLLGAHLAASAPTQSTTNSKSTPSPPPHTTTSHRPTSHPIWHLLLALWRPKDGTHESPGEGNEAVPLPSAARLVQDGGGGLESFSRTPTPTNKRMGVGTTQRPYSESHYAQRDSLATHVDGNTRQHMVSSSPSTPTEHISTGNPQHSVPSGFNTPTAAANTATHIQQHKNIETQTQQHTESKIQSTGSNTPGKDPLQHSDFATLQHPVSSHPQHSQQSTQQHPDKGTAQHPDTDTPQHPARNTKPKPASTASEQHSDATQERDLDTPQHPARNTKPRPESKQHTETNQDPDPDTPQHPARNTQVKPSNTPVSSTPKEREHNTKQHTETHQEPDPDTPQHPARNTQPKPQQAGSTTQHPSVNTQPTGPETQQHRGIGLPKPPTSNTQPKGHRNTSTQHSTEEKRDRDTPQHPARNTKKEEDRTKSTPESDIQSDQSVSSEAPSEIRPQTHSDPSIQPQSHSSPPPHSDPISQPYPSPRSKPQPPASSHTYPAPSSQPHQVLNIRPHLAPGSQTQPTPSSEQHPILNIKSHPDTSREPPPQPTHSRPVFPQPHPHPQQADQPYMSLLHPPHAQYHPTPHTQHHPVLHIQQHPTSQALHHPTQKPEIHPGTPWRMPHHEEPLSLASTDRSQSETHDTQDHALEHDDTSHPAAMRSHGGYPQTEEESSDEDQQTPPKLDDHFFLHPMPHHRDVMFTDPDHHHHHSPSTDGPDHTTTPKNISEVDMGVEDSQIDHEEDATTAASELGVKTLLVQDPAVESREESLAPLLGQAKEVLTLKDNETSVLAMLRTQTSSGSSDTFHADAMMQAEDAGDPGDDLFGVSHHDLRSLEAGVSGTGTAKLVRTESDADKLTVIAKKDAKTLDSRKTVNALDIAEKSDAAAPGTTMKPIYEEISGTLQVDTSIADVEDFDVQIKHTETTDDFLPPVNTSHTNLIDVALHPLQPSDSALPTDHSLTSDPQVPQTPTPLTFTNYPSHYPPKITQDTDNTTAAEAPDVWAPFVDNFSELTNVSLALNASLIQKSHVLSLEEHYRMVLHERGSLMLQLMDPTADPCEDFYQFACGRWNGKFPIRQDKAVDNTFERLKEDLDDVLRSLLEEDPLETDNNITLTVKTLYSGCMNTEAIENLGAEPLLSLLRELGGWPVLEGDSWNSSGYDWVRQMASLRNYNNDILVSEWVAADITNSSNHIIQLDQPELGLPGREYFINPGDFQYREAYLDLMLNVAALLGAQLPTALKDMTEVLHFETHLSRILTPAEERRNLSAVHRRLTVDQLMEEVPQIDWELYLDTITWGNNHTGEVVVFGLDYFKKLVSLLEFTEDRVISNYLLWRFVKNRISNLGERYTKVKQNYIKVLFGRQSQPERWRSCVTYVSGNLGYVVGAMFVKRYFPEASKNDTDEMIGLIRESFGKALRGAHWMNEETRQVAQEKVNTIVKNVGYPEYLLNDTYMDKVYAELSFNRETHFDNVLKMLQFHARTNHDLLSVPVNRTAWVTSPAVVNAYYSRSKNMIVFPAGILQPPFYHPAFPRSLNYGGIGVVIGHEITHGFDDRGRQFDKNGNLQQWWTPSDVSQFYQRASCMLDQYGEYQVDEVGLKINPVNTLGENIADNAGIKIAYQAYQNWRRDNEEHVTLPFVNLTHDQLFFLNFGQIWCEINSPEAMLTKIRSGQHSPNKFRVIGTLSNSEEFSEAFSCPVGSAMNPERKCRVW